MSKDFEHKDITGKKVRIGDVVTLAISHGHSAPSLSVGIVTKFTEHTVTVANSYSAWVDKEVYVRKSSYKYFDKRGLILNQGIALSEEQVRNINIISEKIGIRPNN